ncbi:hypothetical protein V5799_026655 [Amblyomma americanum]|uniref:Uncharacterized protein n=1 Tax=Amblyomma americanum TaxID=6943 RepID=A0AAQ4DHZ6_AMBAM
MQRCQCLHGFVPRYSTHKFSTTEGGGLGIDNKVFALSGIHRTVEEVRKKWAGEMLSNTEKKVWATKCCSKYNAIVSGDTKTTIASVLKGG